MDLTASFHQAIAPVRDALQQLLDSTGRDISVPSADSPAMQEIFLQRQFEGNWGAEPVEHAHTVGVWKRVLSVDCALAMIRDLREEPAPIFSFKVLGRATLENAASAAWILEPGITIRRRIARGRNERIYSARQVLRFGWLSDEERRHSEDIVASIQETGVRLGFSVTAKGWLEEDRLSFTGLLQWLLGGDLGPTIANYYSAVTHGTQYGLASAIIPGSVSVDRPGIQKVAVGPSSSDVNLALAVAGLGLAKALESEYQLMGRDWPEFESSRLGALSLFHAGVAEFVGSTDSVEANRTS